MTRQGTYFKRMTAGLAAIMLVAFLLRLFMLSHQSLWLDEFASWRMAGHDIGLALHGEPTNPPVYYLLLHFWMHWFGSSEFAIRSLSIVPSLFSVWLIYIFAQRLFCLEIAYIAAIYAAISPFQIYYAQEARCFSLLESILLLSIFCLWNASETDLPRTRYRWYGAYAALCTLALYTHFISIFFIAGHALYILVRRPRQVLAAGSSIVVSLLLFAPWLATMLRAAAGGGQRGRHYPLLKLPKAFFSFLYGYSLIPLDNRAVLSVQETLKSNWWILTGALVSLAILAPFWRKAWKRWGDRMLFVFMMAVTPVLLAFLVSLKVMLFDERYLISASPPLYVMIAASIWEIRLLASKKDQYPGTAYAGWIACGVYCSLLALSLYHYYFNPRFGKEQWREADAYIDSLTPPAKSSIIVFDPDYLQHCYSYYTTRNIPTWPVTPKIAFALRSSRKLLDEHTNGFDQILLVRSHADDDTVLSAISGVFDRESYRKFDRANPIEVYSFRASKR